MLCLCWVYVDSNWKWISQRKRGGSEREREWEYQFTYMSWYVTRNALYRTHMVCMCNTRSVRMTQITFNPMRKLFSLHFNRTINTATATTNKLWFGYGHRTWYTPSIPHFTELLHVAGCVRFFPSLRFIALPWFFYSNLRHWSNDEEYATYKHQSSITAFGI